MRSMIGGMVPAGTDRMGPLVASYATHQYRAAGTGRVGGYSAKSNPRPRIPGTKCTEPADSRI
eukprot:834904-Rhodomonas_salina.4